ncbi:MAG: hypothetical protein UX07_C0008G0001 [Parcubacteria group bacterium GW2011_GWA2_45_30]|nr:MAG: hypothetical protein UX07_C0008G0001 [Parcubacteria group bacterium GW2011_GWA2_45_30]
MPTITIPKKIIQKDGFVKVPKAEYEKLVRFWVSAERLTTREKRAVENGLKEIAGGEYYSSKEVRHELGL